MEYQMPSTSEKTAIYLDDKELKSFVLFQKHRNLLERLEQAGIFDTCDAQIVIHKDRDGMVRKIETTRYIVYKGINFNPPLQY